MTLLTAACLAFASAGATAWAQSSPDPGPGAPSMRLALPTATTNEATVPASASAPEGRPATSAGTETAAQAIGRAPASVPKDYRLAPSDAISVRVFGQQDLDATVRLDKNGSVSLPLLGEMRVSGLTLAEAARLIEQALAKDYLVNPQVTVTIVEYAAASFSVMGHVMRPGNFELPPDRSMTLTQALALAGGYTKDADPKHVVVNRIVNGAEKSFTIDASLESATRAAETFKVLPNDTILINYGSRTITLLGQIAHPGYCEIPMGGKMTLVEALTLAGGATGDADLAHIEVRRRVEGSDKVLTLDASGTSPNDQGGFLVLPGDTITVPYSNRTFLVLGQVGRPGIYQVPATGRLSIVKAIAMAGGFTRLASRTVTVKRKAGGKDQVTKVDVNAQSSGKTDEVFEILPEDTITVGESLF